MSSHSVSARGVALASAATVALLVALVGLPRRSTPEDVPGALPDGDGRGGESTYFFLGDPEVECRLFEVAFLVDEERLEDEEQRAARVRRELSSLGPRAIPVVFAVLTGECRLDPDRPPADVTLGAYELPRDLPDLYGVFAEALWEFEPAVVVEYVRSVTPADASIALRLASARVLAGTEDPNSLPVLLRVFAETDPIQFRRPHVRSAFTEALERRLAADPEGFEDARAALVRLDTAALPILVDALPVSEVPAGWELLFDLLDVDDTLDKLVLRRVSELADSLQGDGLDDTLWRVHWLVESDDWEVRRDSAVVMGKLRAPESCGKLIEMLEDEDRRVARSALWALRELSGCAFDDRPGPWRAWHDEQLAWFDGPARALEEDLRSEQRAEVMRAISLLGRHPLWRHHTAELLGPVLWHEDEAVALAACATLARLDSPRAVGALVGRLDGAGEVLAEALQQALVDLTGRELPAHGDAWGEALGL